MIDITDIKNQVQKNILSILTYQKTARFRDMRPPRVDTNLYSYHLTQLLKSGMVKKADAGYTLDTAGLIYADNLNDGQIPVRQQPKIITMFVIQNSDGDLLLQRRAKQPFIDTWTLPYGTVHNDDSSVLASAQRKAMEKLGLQNQQMTHAGDCYIRVIGTGDSVIGVTLAHVFAFNRDDITVTDELQWVRPHKLHQLDLAPAVEQIAARTFFRDPFFFEEFTQDW